MIRIARIQHTANMLSGMYARSEGPEVVCTETHVHPDDIQRLWSIDEVNGYCFRVCREEGLGRDWWSCILDVLESGEDGDPEAQAFYNRYDQLRSEFRRPTYTETDDESAINWPTLPFNAMLAPGES